MPVRIGFLVGLLVVGVPQIFRDAYIRIAVHSERVFTLRNGLYSGDCCGGVARKALGLAKVQLPPAFLRCGERVQVSRWRPIFGGIVLRTEGADLSRGLVCSECLTEELVDLLRGIDAEDVLAVHLLE